MGEDASDEPAPFGATNDHPSTTDHLGFEPYVAAVHYFLTHEETTPPLTLSVEGEWGSGKSSFMQQLCESLEAEGETTVEFNPWKHEQQEALWASFAITFVDSLKQSIPLTRRPQKFFAITWQRLLSETSNAALIKFTGGFILSLIALSTVLWIWLTVGVDWVVTALSATGLNLRYWLGTSGVIVSVLAGIDLTRRAYSIWSVSIHRSFSQRLNDPTYQERTEFLESFQADLERVLDVYGDDGPVYVFMDDVDRCTVPRAADLMRSINLMVSDDSQLIFIIGLDRERVAAGIAAKHNELLDYIDGEIDNEEPIEFGYRYLEKFIQIPFVVPEPKGEDIQRLVRGNILDAETEDASTDREDIATLWEENLAAQFEATLDDIVAMAAPALGNNPRQVKRFLNLYRLRAVLAESEGLLADRGEDPVGDTITLPQLAKFVVISIQWPSFVTAVSNDPTALERVSDYATGEEEDAEKYDILQTWADTDPLLELLAYGEGDRYQMQSVSVVDLKKISPRVDRPAQSEQDEMDRRVQVAFFDDATYDPEKIKSKLESISETLELDLKLRVFEGAREKPIADIDELYYCFIWIADPTLLAKTWFQRLCKRAPEQLQIISLSPDTELLDPPIDRAVESVDTLDDLTTSLEQELKTIDAVDESGETQWEEWQRSLAELRDIEDTEIID
nr:P-loop NTPase fold protein [Haloferax elongans]